MKSGTGGAGARRNRDAESRPSRALGFIETLLNFDRLYVGGGNARQVTLRLPQNVKLVANDAGNTGGVRLRDRSLDTVFAGG